MDDPVPAPSALLSSNEHGRSLAAAIGISASHIERFAASMRLVLLGYELSESWVLWHAAVLRNLMLPAARTMGRGQELAMQELLKLIAMVMDPTLAVPPEMASLMQVGSRLVPTLEEAVAFRRDVIWHLLEENAFGAVGRHVVDYAVAEGCSLSKVPRQTSPPNLRAWKRVLSLDDYLEDIIEGHLSSRRSPSRSATLPPSALSSPLDPSIQYKASLRSRRTSSCSIRFPPPENVPLPPSPLSSCSSPTPSPPVAHSHGSSIFFASPVTPSPAQGKTCMSSATESTRLRSPSSPRTPSVASRTWRQREKGSRQEVESDQVGDGSTGLVAQEEEDEGTVRSSAIVSVESSSVFATVNLGTSSPTSVPPSPASPSSVELQEGATSIEPSPAFPQVASQSPSPSGSSRHSRRSESADTRTPSPLPVSSRARSSFYDAAGEELEDDRVSALLDAAETHPEILLELLLANDRLVKEVIMAAYDRSLETVEGYTVAKRSAVEDRVRVGPTTYISTCASSLTEHLANETAVRGQMFRSAEITGTFLLRLLQCLLSSRLDHSPLSDIFSSLQSSLWEFERRTGSSGAPLETVQDQLSLLRLILLHTVTVTALVDDTISEAAQIAANFVQDLIWILVDRVLTEGTASIRSYAEFLHSLLTIASPNGIGKGGVPRFSWFEYLLTAVEKGMGGVGLAGTQDKSGMLAGAEEEGGEQDEVEEGGQSGQGEMEVLDSDDPDTSAPLYGSANIDAQLVSVETFPQLWHAMVGPSISGFSSTRRLVGPAESTMPQVKFSAIRHAMVTNMNRRVNASLARFGFVDALLARLASSSSNTAGSVSAIGFDLLPPTPLAPNLLALASDAAADNTLSSEDKLHKLSVLFKKGKSKLKGLVKARRGRCAE